VNDVGSMHTHFVRSLAGECMMWSTFEQLSMEVCKAYPKELIASAHQRIALLQP
jgi:hypothetical protein